MELHDGCLLTDSTNYGWWLRLLQLSEQHQNTKDKYMISARSLVDACVVTYLPLLKKWLQFVGICDT